MNSITQKNIGSLLEMKRKRKIINDPLHGFITFPSKLVYKCIDHPSFQRLRRIRQLGLSSYVYPGATHTRFQHALGVAHLADQTIKVLKDNGVKISKSEWEGTIIAALLHDVGHGPFSHVLEGVLIDCAHEELSIQIMHQMNLEFGGKLDLAISIFEGNYPRRFFRQIVSSQLDMDRIDYLSRDSFYTGVVEGLVGGERLLSMMDVVDEQLVIEEKGIYSVENFLFARHFMYRQVYLHKVVLVLDDMLKIFLHRYKKIYKEKRGFSEPLIDILRFSEDKQNVLDKFLLLDDIDVFYVIKRERLANDKILSYIAKSILNRQLFRIKFIKEENLSDLVESQRINVVEKLNFTFNEANFLVNSSCITNEVYTFADEIKVLLKSGEVKPISGWSFLQNLDVKDEINYITFPKHDCS